MLPFSPFLLFVLPEVMSCLASSCAKYLSLILPTLPETLSMHFPVQLFLETLCSELSFSSDSPARPLGWQHAVSPAFAAAGVLPFSWGEPVSRIPFMPSCYTLVGVGASVVISEDTKTVHL